MAFTSTVDLVLPIAAFSIATWLFWGRWGHLFIDVGREAYVPAALLGGRRLIKDIFLIYGPLSYQLNALLLGLFGISLTTLYGAGLVSTAISLVLLFLLLRVFLPRSICYAAVCFVASCCAFRVHIFNWIFPYSFAATYGVLCLLGAILSTVSWDKNGRFFHLVLSSFLCGCAAALKWDYLMPAIPLVLHGSTRSGPTKWQRALWFGALLAIPLLSYGSLVSQGVSLSDFSDYLHGLIRHAQAPSTWFLYTQFLGFSPSAFSLAVALRACLITGLTFGLAALINYLMFKVSYRKEAALAYRMMTLIVLAYCTVAVAYLMPAKTEISALGLSTLILTIGGCASIWAASEMKTKTPIAATLQRFALGLLCSLSMMPLMFQTIADLSFSFLGYTALLPALWAVTPKGRRIFQAYIAELRLSEGAVLCVYSVCILASAKNLFLVNTGSYGTLAVPFLLIVHLFTLKILSRLWEPYNPAALAFVVSIILSACSLVFISRSLHEAYSADRTVLDDPRGTIAGPTRDVTALEQIVSYLRNETKESDVVVVWPEGELINFLSPRPSDGKFGRLIPPYLDTTEVEDVIEMLQTVRPVVIIHHRNLPEYGRGSFCADFGQEVCGYLKTHYALVRTFEGTDRLGIYRPALSQLKNNNGL